MKEIILASASPRRKELLEQIGLTFTVRPSTAEEQITKSVPSEVVEELSLQKAQDIAQTVKEGIIIGSDTVVCQGGMIMGKPADRRDAGRMLRLLQGSTHSVYTGVTVIVKENGRERIHTFSKETKVSVHSMTEAETEKYLDTGEPMDKAGAYGIQGQFAAWIDGIEGDYNNVVGLPVCALYQVLKQYL